MKVKQESEKVGLKCNIQKTKIMASGLNSSAQFSHSVVSNSLRPHEPQHARPPCPSPTPRVHPNSCPLSQWCHPTISSSVVPFSSCPQSFPASGSFQMSQLFASGSQSIGVSASTSVLPMSTQDWFPLGWTGWISLQSKRLSRVFSNTTVQKHQFFGTQLFFIVQLIARVRSDSCLLSQWCHPTISSFVFPFSSCLHQGLFQWVGSSNQVARVL